jgi:quercetin dioxygenase-like cupin family protein
VLRVDLELHEITDWSSKGVKMQELLRRDDLACRTNIAYYDSESVLGRHAGTLWQLFMVIGGSGWVSGQDQVKRTCATGDVVVWAPGESHESGSDPGMTVVIVQSDQSLHP